MKINIDPVATQKIAQLLKREEIAILIIEDSRELQLHLEKIFTEAFPNATVYSFEGFGVDEHELEFLIEKGGYDIVSVDGSLNTWNPHPVFGTRGTKIVQYIKEVVPKTFVISCSSDPLNNDLSIKRGADMGGRKRGPLQPCREGKKYQRTGVTLSFLFLET